ncbi:MAG: ABC transporter substrate-binding protein aliphatic [Geobacteraceae bacterium]|nr:MAG: ABC transporter substrate-binding protein aliphatic [Geobacteraceae bacterium]
MKRVMRTWIAVGIAAAVSVIGAGAAFAAKKQADTGVIRVGTNKALGTVTPYVGRTQGIFAKRGVTVEIVDFNDGTTLMEAFASGQLDVALLGIAPTAIWHGKGVPLKVVASANGGGHVLLTRQDTGITDVKQLKGKKVATPKPGTVTDTLFRVHIAGTVAGLDPSKDIQIVPSLAPADIPTALFVGREVDAAITWEPFASQAEAKFKNARVLFDAAAEWKKSNPKAAHFYPTNVVVARQSFIDQRNDELKRFLAAYVETIDFINKKPREANEIIAREVKLDPATIANARKRVDYTAAVDVPAALQTLSWSKKLGYLKEIPAENRLFDLSYLPAQAAPKKKGRK